MNREREYEPEVTKLFKAILRPGDTCLDIGANTGWFTTLAAELVGPQGRVIAFEPAPENLENLRNNIYRGSFTNVTVVEAALSDSDGTANFYLNPYGDGGHALWDAQSHNQPYKKPTVIQVKQLKLDSWLGHYQRPKLVKIDTEGCEQRILTGAKNLLEMRPPYLIVELHTRGLAAFGDNESTLRHILHECGYSAFLLDVGFPIPVLCPPNTAIDTPYTHNILFTNPELLGLLYPRIEFMKWNPGNPP